MLEVGKALLLFFWLVKGSVVVAGAGSDVWIAVGIIRRFGYGDGVVKKMRKLEVRWIAGCRKIKSVCQVAESCVRSINF